jgi:hypothetical protein
VTILSMLLWLPSTMIHNFYMRVSCVRLACSFEPIML